MMVDKKNKICTHPNYKIVMLLIPFFPERNEIQRFSRTWISLACQATPSPPPQFLSCGKSKEQFGIFALCLLNNWRREYNL